MRIVKEAYRDTRHIGVFHAPHQHSRTAFRAKKLIKTSTKISRAAEMFRFPFNFDLIVRIIGRFSKGRPGPLLAGEAVASDNSHGRAGHFNVQLSALT